MIRQLLTLVAILTGLTALGAPAQARVTAMEEVRVQVARDATVACSPVTAMAGAAGIVPVGRTRQAGNCLRLPIVAFVSPVVSRADRARE